jgi:hypothetical protein
LRRGNEREERPKKAPIRAGNRLDFGEIGEGRYRFERKESVRRAADRSRGEIRKTLGLVFLPI